jgi:hypothetical protein
MVRVGYPWASTAPHQLAADSIAATANAFVAHLIVFLLL